MSLGTRKPCFAGQFYDSNKISLHRYLTGVVQKELNTERTSEHIRAVILPHAGYCFSAQTAIKTLLRAIDGNYSEILVIAPSHRVPFRGIALAEFDTYRTPLGDIPVDLESVANIAGTGNDYIAYMSDAHEKEHSLEVELPLLQHFFPEFKLIPIISGLIDENSARHIAAVLKNWWREDILWVISSDFTHYGHSFNYVPFNKNIKERLRLLDLGAVQLIINNDLHGFCEYLDKTRATICGYGAIQILLAVLEQTADKDTSGAELVHYTTSGDLTSNYAHCVSYAGITFFDQNSKE
ncbi:MAG: AmmeMemoRadiSam system protein B [Victivallaceae bacterium]|nr:AmmeMemoRadiSam system protein B [Victivallaceae bacterium]